MGNASHHGKTVTLKDIAARCGLSVTAVSAALRGNDRYISAARMAEVRALAAELGYDPMRSLTARKLRYTQTGAQVLYHTIAFHIYIPQADNPYTGRVLAGFGQALKEQDYALLVNWFMSEDDPAYFPPAFRHLAFDGVATMVASRRNELLFRRLRDEYHFAGPGVSVLDRLDTPSSSVTTDDLTGGYRAMRHLLRLGHRCIGTMINDPYPHLQRELGYLRAIEELGLRGEVRLPHFPWQYEDPEAAAAHCDALLARYDCTAVLAGSDLIARDLCLYLRARGRRIPEELSLIGHDGTHAIHGAWGENMLTTVQLPLDEAGYESARLLVKRIRGEEPRDVHLTLPVTFVERHSTAPPRTGAWTPCAGPGGRIISP